MPPAPEADQPCTDLPGGSGGQYFHGHTPCWALLGTPTPALCSMLTAATKGTPVPALVRGTECTTTTSCTLGVNGKAALLRSAAELLLWSPALTAGTPHSATAALPQVVLCFSPVGSTLRVRARRFPAVVNCTAIDWFHEWPEDALVSVSSRFLEETPDIEVSWDPSTAAVLGTGDPGLHWAMNCSSAALCVQFAQGWGSGTGNRSGINLWLVPVSEPAALRSLSILY